MIITLSSVSLCHAWVWHEMILTAESKRAKEQQRKTHIHTFDVSSEMEKSSMHPSSSPASFEISIEIALSLSLSPWQCLCLCLSPCMRESVYLSIWFANKQSSVSLQHIYIVTNSLWFWDFKMEMEIQTFNDMKSIWYLFGHKWYAYTDTRTHTYMYVLCLRHSAALSCFFRMVLCWVEFLLSNCQWAMLDYRLFVYHLNSISFLWQSHLYTTLYEK